MLYQLPNGKTIYLTTEQYLGLTDEDIQYLMSVNAGASVTSPWHGSSIHKRRRPDIEEEEPLQEDDPYEDMVDDDEDILDHEDLVDDDLSDVDFEID